MSSTPAVRRVRSAYLADPGARLALRDRWPALAAALDALAAEEADGGESTFLDRGELQEISERYRRSPWDAPPNRRG